MNRRLMVLTVILASFVTLVGVSHPLTVNAACSTLSGSYAASGPGLNSNGLSSGFGVSAGDTVHATVSASGATNQMIDLYIFAVHSGGSSSATSSFSTTLTAATSGFAQVQFNTQGGTGTVNWTVQYCHGSGGGGSSSSGGNQVTTWNFTDGRLNSHDGAQTAAVYCESNGDITVYAVIDSVGHWVFRATKAEIAAVPLKPAKNTLIKAAEHISLYRLVGGKLQINAPDNYLFIWDGCAAA